MKLYLTVIILSILSGVLWFSEIDLWLHPLLGLAFASYANFVMHVLSGLSHYLVSLQILGDLFVFAIGLSFIGSFNES